MEVTYTVPGIIDVYMYPGAWRRPSEWVWGRDHSCREGCFILNLGFFQITVFRKGCRG